VLLEEGKLRPALFTFKRALALFKKSEVPWHAVPVYKDMAVIWRELGDFDSCMYMHQLAWEQVLPEIPFQEAPASQLLPYWPKNNLHEILVEQGNSLQLRFEQSKQVDDLTAALSAYQMALAVADSQRTYYDSPASRQQGVQKHHTTTENAIHLAHDLFRMTADRTYLEQAFLLAENSKAENLRDHLQSNEALRFSGIPDSLLEREQYFQQRIAALEALNYQEESDSLQVAEAQALQFKLNQQYRIFLQKLEKTYPRYFQLKYPSTALSTRAVNERLSSQQAFYSYFWGERFLFVFTAFQGKWQMKEIVLTEDFEEKLNTWLGFIAFPPEENSYPLSLLSENTIALTNSLLPGLSSDMQQLLIIPDGPLGYLPFESLLVAKTGSQNWKDWPYLFLHHTSTYSYSAALWLQQNMSNHASKASYMGFAPVYKAGAVADSRTAPGSLLYNQDEVKETAERLKGKALLGPLAKESFVKKLSSSSQILHFATHALADENDLMRSRLFLDGSEDPGEDGILYAYEIYNLRLNSPLLVLSACQTAVGPIQQGEGVMSLARAFQYSGAARVLSTLWQADDRAGGEISKAFFAGLQAELPAETALQQARQQWLNQADNQHSHPYYWANYVLIGDGGIIPIQKTRPWAWIFLISFLTLALSLALVWKRREERAESREQKT
jgi:CHAT domain-containing protein